MGIIACYTQAKIAFANANPLKYADDDVFGYMKAAKEVVLDEDGNTKKDKKGKDVTENVTVTRISPLKNSAIISVASVNPEENWSSMARQEGDSVPYGKHEYSAIMKGMFSIDLSQIGTFSNYNKTGYVNLSDILKKEALDNGAIEIEDEYVPNYKLIRIKRETRVKRVVDTIRKLRLSERYKAATWEILLLNLSYWLPQKLVIIISHVLGKIRL
ncbi:hypothetical protein MASR1M74_09370 [Lentimicrobium sp.]